MQIRDNVLFHFPKKSRKICWSVLPRLLRQFNSDAHCKSESKLQKLMEKRRRIAAAVICAVTLLLLRVFFTLLFFISSVICIVKAESRVESCDGQLTISQKAVDSLNTTSTFVETLSSCFLISPIHRWKRFNFKNFLRALPRQGDFWMWTTLWIARIFTNILIDIIPGINRNYHVLVVLGVSLSLEFASCTIFACALVFVRLRNVTEWLTHHFPGGRAEKLTALYRAILFTYGLRMLALFLYDSFLVARHITRQSEYRELDSVLLALDVGYRGSLSIFFFRKFFEFDIPDVFEEEADINLSNPQLKCQSQSKEGVHTGTRRENIDLSQPQKNAEAEDNESEEKGNLPIRDRSDKISEFSMEAC